MPQNVRNPDQTRASLINAAFQTIYQHGYQGMRVDDVLERTGLKKGAFYHHFPSKLELGYAVLDEIITGYIHDRWLQPLSEHDDPIEGIAAAIRIASQNASVECGCPLNNLAQEMSPLDEGFRQRIKHLFELWVSGTADALQRGQEKGFIRQDVNTIAAANFIIASIEGAVALVKASQDTKQFEHCWKMLRQFLHSLRPTQQN